MVCLQRPHESADDLVLSGPRVFAEDLNCPLFEVGTQIREITPPNATEIKQCFCISDVERCVGSCGCGSVAVAATQQSAKIPGHDEGLIGTVNKEEEEQEEQKVVITM